MESQGEDPGGSWNRLNSLLLPERGGVPTCCPLPALAGLWHSSHPSVSWQPAPLEEQGSKNWKSHSNICLAKFFSPYPSVYHPKSDFFPALQVYGMLITSYSFAVQKLFKVPFSLVPPLAPTSFVAVKPFSACVIPSM